MTSTTPLLLPGDAEHLPALVLWGPEMTQYDFGPHHPMHPSRLDATARLVRELGLLDLPHVATEQPEVASDAALLTAHTQAYLDVVKAVGKDPSRATPESGLDGEETPGFLGIHEASARLAGGTLQAAAALAEERVVHAVNFGGGMHHAHADHASGFCVYNDCAVGIRYLLDHGFERVLYVDVDAHHGDGTQSIFWDDPRVMTISLHETGMSLFPGTGYANESGPEGAAAGTAVNVALPTTVSDAAWLRAFHAVVPQLARAFEPQAIVSQHGCDSHFRDDLTHMRISTNGQREATLAVADLANELCEDRWIATGGGGYNVLDVVPRAWAQLVAVAAGRPLQPGAPTPQAWRDYLQEKYGVRAPELLDDEAETWWRSWEVGYDPADNLDRTVMATRKQVFPLWGLDPWFD